MRWWRRHGGTALIVILLLIGITATVAAAAPAVPLPDINIGIGQSSNPQDVASSLQIIVLLTILTLAPSLLILMTSFTRIVIVLSFVRNALATQQMPPNQVLIGLALFLTFFVMAPTFAQVNRDALQPYLAGQIAQDEALKRAEAPMRAFMLKQFTSDKDLALFVSLAGLPKPNSSDDVPTYALIPAFALSELKKAFQMGFMIFIPFIVIDMIVASTLMSMGMMMLPPMMISLPFKIILFVLVDGWYLVAKSLISSFQ